MDLKKPISSKPWNLSGKRKNVLIIFSLIFASLLIFIIAALSLEFLQQKGFHINNVRSTIKSPLVFLSKWIKGKSANPETLYIDIKFLDLQKLAYQRELALAEKFLTSGDDDFVPAQIRHNNDKVKVKMRLKGDQIDHLLGDKWSFRIHTRGDDTLFGMKRLSIQNPNTRNFLSEWVYHKALKREGIIGLRYDFIRVVVNGKDLGIYAVEEHFDKRLIENNKRREGPIVRFDETVFWKTTVQDIRLGRDIRSHDQLYLISKIDAFQTNKYLSDPAMKHMHEKAINLLEAFRRGKVKVSDAFDVPITAKYFALADLLGTRHGSSWNNIRFYFNPVTSKLEPIGFDGNMDILTSITSLTAQSKPFDKYNLSDKMSEHFFEDEEFYKAYIKALEAVSSKDYLDEMFAELAPELEEKLSIIYNEFPKYSFGKKVYYINRDLIRRLLNPTGRVHAYYEDSDGRSVTLRIANAHSLALEITGLTMGQNKQLIPESEQVLPQWDREHMIDYKTIKFLLPKGQQFSENMASTLNVSYKILGSSTMREMSVTPWRFLPEDFTSSDFTLKPANAHTFDFIVKNEETKTYTIMPGQWDVNRDMIFPSGYEIIAGEGVSLDLRHNALLFSRSPLKFTGTADNPILIHSSDSSGQAVAVIGAGRISTLRNIVFRNLSNPDKKGYSLTGAVTFYESPVEIQSAAFLKNRSEDGLNIIRSRYTIDKSMFSDTYSDAFDADFSDGVITSSSFINCGNDAIDISGSQLVFKKVTVNGAGDKGISAGENSLASGRDISVSNTYIAIASKDMSEIEIKRLKIGSSTYGFSLYQKKSEFGPGTLSAVVVSHSDIKNLHIIEKGSTLTLEGRRIDGKKKNVYKKLYGDK